MAARGGTTPSASPRVGKASPRLPRARTMSSLRGGFSASLASPSSSRYSTHSRCVAASWVRRIGSPCVGFPRDCGVCCRLVCLPSVNFHLQLEDEAAAAKTEAMQARKDTIETLRSRKPIFTRLRDAQLNVRHLTEELASARATIRTLQTRLVRRQSSLWMRVY